MNYIPLEEMKNAWIFRHKSLVINDNDLAKIKPMTTSRANVVWDTFISRQVDHPEFFKKGDWAFNDSSWLETLHWEKRWESETAELPEEVTEHLAWDNNTVVYFCCNRKLVIETTWDVFKRTWKNFLFMDDGSVLIGKKRKEVVQFLSNGNCKLGKKS